MTLVMFALSNEGGATVDEAWEAINSAVWLFTELSSTSFIAEECAAILKEFTTKQTTSPTHTACEDGISIYDTGCKPPPSSSTSKYNSSASQSIDSWPIMSSWTDQLSDIAKTCFSPSADLLDMLDAVDRTAGMPPLPTNDTTNDTISDDNSWLDESLELSIEASLAMQNDVSAFWTRPVLISCSPDAVARREASAT
ncbi:hypothetical protein LTR72_011803 [Exophiala xenobiotica]|nr:hypothetical protein LTR72_011803 [Exophiala xenobiotica]KAK5463780.1 hypothetical protein LTR55_011826 [Exophiala xenobiotica]